MSRRRPSGAAFPGIYVPSIFGNMAQCTALALATERIAFATAIAPIYARTVEDFAHSAAYIHEISGGRFRFGIGVAHAPEPYPHGRDAGQAARRYPRLCREIPLLRGHRRAAADRARGAAQAHGRAVGRDRQGVIFANASRSHMAESLSVIPAEKRRDPDFLVANMIPTCISDDVEAAKAVNRRTLTRYTMLPNYRNYWKEAGYVEEMAAIETAIAEGRQNDIPSLMSDRWLADATLFGPAQAVRDGVAAWREAGVSTPILVPSSATGNQLKAVEEIFAAFA